MLRDEPEHKDLTFMLLWALQSLLYDCFGFTASSFNVLINSIRPCSQHKYVPQFKQVYLVRGEKQILHASVHTTAHFTKHEDIY